MEYQSLFWCVCGEGSGGGGRGIRKNNTSWSSARFAHSGEGFRMSMEVKHVCEKFIRYDEINLIINPTKELWHVNFLLLSKPSNINRFTTEFLKSTL